MTDTKEQRSAEERAELRYPDHTEPDAMIGVRPWQLTRLAYAAAIAEEVEPLEAEVARLKALVGEAKGELEGAAHSLRSSAVNEYAHCNYQDAEAIEVFLTKLSKEGAADTLGVRAEDSAPGQTGVPSSLRSDPLSAAPNVHDAPSH